jgi:hypothetical protein
MMTELPAEERDGYNGRWYDKRPITAKAMELLESFPAEIQSIVSKGVLELAEKEYKVNEMVKSYKTLGKEKILGLYMSKRKLRSMDEIPMVHKVITHLYVLAPEAQDFMAEKIIEMMSVITQYMKTCQEYEAEPKDEEIIDLTHQYVALKNDQVQAFLAKLETQFLQKVKNRGKKKRVVLSKDSGSVNITDRGGGMKIRGDMAPSEDPPAS